MQVKRFLLSVLKEKKKIEKLYIYMYRNFAHSYLAKKIKGFLLKLKCSFSCKKRNSILNLVPFNVGIKELCMSENCNVVLPVNMPTPFTRPVFLAARHYRVMCLATPYQHH